MAAARPLVLLISDAPLAHTAAAHDLLLRGYRVQVAGTDPALHGAFDLAPDFVLVDLVYPPRVGAGPVRRLNARQHAAMVFAIHDGRLNDRLSTLGPLADLAFDGYCRQGEPLRSAWLLSRGPSRDHRWAH